MCLHVGECFIMPELYVNMHEVVCVHTSVCVAMCLYVFGCDEWHRTLSRSKITVKKRILNVHTTSIGPKMISE